MNTPAHRYGWKPDVPDMRDHVAQALPPTFAPPPHADLRLGMPDVYDQGNLGSCTANAIAGALQYARRKQKFEPDFAPSRLFVYYNERLSEGTVDSDAGAFIRDGIKAVGKLGDIPESEWPYDVSKFADSPPAACYADALKYRVLDYWRVPRQLSQMKGALSVGFPFVFGFSVYQSFEGGDVATTGRVPMPAPTEQLLGGHAVLAVGYDDPAQVFIVRNSWGSGWGDKGYFYLPYAFLLDPSLSDDMWCIKAEAE